MEDSFRFRYVPEEIVLKILPALPGKSLLRFRCVSKQWSRWISRTKLGQSKKLMVQSLFISLDERFFRSVDEKLQVKDIDMSQYTIDPRISSLEASCDGLLLIKIFTDLFLWNPTIHSCWKVLSYECDEEYAFVAGLCYDSHNNDYKVVMVAGNFTRDYVQVGSCRNNSWQVIKFPYNLDTVHSGPVVNNYIHWYASPDNDYYYTSNDKIIYFDPKMNLFLEVPMPDPKGAYGDRIHGLGVLDGCLTMAREEAPKQDISEVFVMKEYGVKESWQTLFKIERGRRMILRVIPYFFCSEKKDEVLMEIGCDVVTINVHTGEEVLNVKGYGYMYEETMVEPSKYLTEKSAPDVDRINVQKVIVHGSKPFSFQSINQLAEVEDIEIKGMHIARDPDVFPCIYGSCNGFLLIRVGVTLYLWNPLFRFTKGTLIYELLKRYPPGKVVSGLCLDSDKNDYKVVLVLDHNNWRERSVVVGSFRTKSWFEIYFQHVSKNLKCGPTLNNRLHMWSSNADSADQIVYFDPKIDKFGRIPLPDLPSQYRKSCIRGLGVLGGHLCLVHNDSYHGNKVYEMKQHGVKVTWTCLFRFTYKNLSRATPLFFCDEEKSKVLIHATRSGGYAAILSCNIGNKLCTEVVVLNVEEGSNDGPFVYEETFGRPASLKKAPTTSSCRNEADITNRRKRFWGVGDNICLMELTKTETEQVNKGKKAAHVLSSSNPAPPHMSNAFDVLAESEY